MYRFLPLFLTLVLLKQFAFAITFYYNSKTTKELPDYFLHFHLRIAQLLLRKLSKQMSMNPRPYPKNSIIICLTLSFMLSGNKISQRNFTSLFFFFSLQTSTQQLATDLFPTDARISFIVVMFGLQMKDSLQGSVWFV